MIHSHLESIPLIVDAHSAKVVAMILALVFALISEIMAWGLGLNPSRRISRWPAVVTRVE